MDEYYNDNNTVTMNVYVVVCLGAVAQTVGAVPLRIVFKLRQFH